PGPCAGTLQPNEDGVVTPIMESIGGPFKFPPDHVAMNEFYAHSHATPQVMARVLLNPEKYHLPYELEAMLNCGANSIRSQMDRQIMIDGFKKVPFIVTFALNYDETTMMSDIVLTWMTVFAALRWRWVEMRSSHYSIPGSWTMS
ncbi:MAG: hypothetical protein H6Q41_1334, partial [Deltaproteobacteria bacterium]|nr:hypothetical protein [Deltaproteobacteria bacterium]